MSALSLPKFTALEAYLATSEAEMPPAQPQLVASLVKSAEAVLERTRGPAFLAVLERERETGEID